MYNINEIYTLIGKYTPHNTLILLSGEEFKVLTYRKFNSILYNKLIVANVKYSENANAWVIFQAIEITQEELGILRS